ncbi:AP3-complex subunit beta-A [Acorus calamus]|uniref:AP-3 complex subunit beta n=1 Tax=Acorus calamus TaxID=4465 RepID=A0AAV9DGE5_ACOCL|nr:AP3-complex subunit beta-A [Acorus calamus]
MFPQFGATAESLTRASSLVFRIGTDAHLYDDPEDVSIPPLLESKFDSEVVEALKRLLALIAQGADVSNFFPQVVKNVASPSLEVKKLVYLYLLHYAQKRPSEALLSINCFQKDLSDPNPLVRAWALRAMAGIRLHVIAPLVLVAVTKCAKDPSPYVRKCAANAIPKLYDLQREQNASDLEELVGMLLSDHSPGVVGAAAAAFNAICRSNLPIIGRNFRKLCETLPDVEEWGQIILIGILLRYVTARYGLMKETVFFSSLSNGTSHSDDECDSAMDEISSTDLKMSVLRSYIKASEEHSSPLGFTENRTENILECANFMSSQNDEVKVFLQCTSPLLWSQNCAVVLAAAGVHWIMASKEDVKKIVKPVLFLLRSSPDSRYVVLCNILVFAKVVPSLFAPYYEDFFASSSDSYQTRTLKLKILSIIADDSSVPLIFQEFQDYIKDPDMRFVTCTVGAIGLCAQRLSSVAQTCLDALLALIRQMSSVSDSCSSEGEAGVLVQAVMSIRIIIKQNPTTYEKVIVQLVRSLDVIKVPVARAIIVWMLGEYSSIGQIIPRMALSVFEYLACSFASEEVETKHQILNLAAKFTVCAEGEDLQTFKKILTYIIEVAKYDLNYDVRDRARIIMKLLHGHTTTTCPEEGTSFLLHNDVWHDLLEQIFTGKTKWKSSVLNDLRFYLPGSLSQIVLHAAPGYESLPKPGSLLESDLNIRLEAVQEVEILADKNVNRDSFESDEPESLSGSSEEESDYNSGNSIVDSAESEVSGYARDDNENNHGASSLISQEGVGVSNQLIHLSDDGNGVTKSVGNAWQNTSNSLPIDLVDMMSKSALETWLDEQPGNPESSSSTQGSGQLSSARVSVKDIGGTVKPKVHSLLDPVNQNGLRVDYSYSSEISSISPLLVCIEVSFMNQSDEHLTKIAVVDEEFNGDLYFSMQEQESNESSKSADVPTMIPMEEIASLDPGQTEKKLLQVRFYHHLLPLKLAVCCNGKKFPIKLWPDIGYFIRPLSMNVESFTDKESQLLGMFEYMRRCTFTDHLKDRECEKDQISFDDDKVMFVCRTIASKMLSNANLFLVSVDMPVSASHDDLSGACLRFSSEILSSSNPCLITLRIEGKCSNVGHLRQSQLC